MRQVKKFIQLKRPNKYQEKRQNKLIGRRSAKTSQNREYQASQCGTIFWHLFGKIQ